MKPALLVFLHGFLGSDQSFRSFPSDLLDRLAAEVPETRFEYKIYPTFNTKGNNKLAVQKLVDWLLLYATTATYSQVIILAHSMGGILAADAYIDLYKPKPKHVPTVSNSYNLIATLLSSVNYLTGNTRVENEEKNMQDSTDLRHLVNITCILAFDSPFYGVSSDISFTGVSKAASIAKGVSTTGIALTGTAIAATFALGQYIPSAALSTASSLTTAAITWAAEEARLHLEFLYPLSESRLDMENRVYCLIHDEHLEFGAIFISISTFDGAESSKHFCVTPSKDSYFDTVSSVYADEIEAHMNIFDSVNHKEYTKLLDWSVKKITTHGF